MPEPYERVRAAAGASAAEHPYGRVIAAGTSARISAAISSTSSGGSCACHSRSSP
ncbi:hypothetical protein [Lentzea jiangxiensis]|uniref:Uncharacterized protein n=1 Tax=Lentzea jiangxiensis TaxID=641025 RepID=A0A1H0LVE7_9PSEU|nr:hypothetical protein [Lentzea jiangxiensis]SDO72147.1 hypothetical protein SAMN05421507_103469 [Lentzea jiangxiensis]